jgi:hypothetical protein
MYSVRPCKKNKITPSSAWQSEYRNSRETMVPCPEVVSTHNREVVSTHNRTAIGLDGAKKLMRNLAKYLKSGESDDISIICHGFFFEKDSAKLMRNFLALKGVKRTKSDIFVISKDNILILIRLLGLRSLDDGRPDTASMPVLNEDDEPHHQEDVVKSEVRGDHLDADSTCSSESEIDDQLSTAFL